MLCFHAQGRPEINGFTILAFEPSIQEIARVKLQSRLGGKDLQFPAADGIYQGGNRFGKVPRVV